MGLHGILCWDLGLSKDFMMTTVGNCLWNLTMSYKQKHFLRLCNIYTSPFCHPSVLSMYLTINLDLAKLQQNTWWQKFFKWGVVFVLETLTEHSWAHSLYFIAYRSTCRRWILILTDITCLGRCDLGCKKRSRSEQRAYFLIPLLSSASRLHIILNCRSFKCLAGHMCLNKGDKACMCLRLRGSIWRAIYINNCTILESPYVLMRFSLKREQMLTISRFKQSSSFCVNFWRPQTPTNRLHCHSQ